MFKFFSLLKDKKERNKEEYIKKIVERAALGDREAQFKLAQHYEDQAKNYEQLAEREKDRSELEKYRIETAKYYRHAYEEYEKAANQDHAQAKYYQGYFLLTGKGGVRRNPNQGIDLIEASANLGYKQAMFTLADVFQKGLHGISVDLQKAKQAIVGIADDENNAALKMGRICEAAGHIAEAKVWYKRAVSSDTPIIKTQAKNCLQQLNSSKNTPIERGNSGLLSTQRLTSLMMCNQQLRDIVINYDDVEFDRDEAGKKIILGKGGYGDVRLATWQYTKVAVKTLNKLTRDQPEELKAFIREMTLMIRLRHENIILLYGVTEHQSNLYMIMDYMPNGSLDGILYKNDRPLSWDQRFRFAKDIASGLAYLHSQTPPILHRDLKSGNVLLSSLMTAKLTDFGLSRPIASTMTQTILGTPSWIAPEIFADNPIYSEKSDVYALGMIFWEIASREVPFNDCRHGFEIPKRVLAKERPPIPEDCPQAFKKLIERCWQPEPDDRPTANEVVEYLIANKNEIVNYKSIVPNPGPMSSFGAT